nr:hypothetical protein L203_03386 [Cryptococcus depauperatus CBS 7841]
MSSISPAKLQENVQVAVLYKLVIFAVLMAVVPIATYFVSLHYVLKSRSCRIGSQKSANFLQDSTTGAAISAIVTANAVLVGWVVVAFREESPPAEKVTEGKKER